LGVSGAKIAKLENIIDEQSERILEQETTVEDLEAYRSEIEQLAKEKIQTLKTSLRYEKKTSANALAEVSHLKFMLQEEVSKIARFKSIISKHYIINEELESANINIKQKEDLICLLNLIGMERNDKNRDVTTVGYRRNGDRQTENTRSKNMALDKDLEVPFLKKDLNKIEIVKDKTNKTVQRKPSFSCAMSISETGNICPQLGSIMSVTNEDVMQI